MSNLIESIIAKAKTFKKTIVLPESSDGRILKAAIKIQNEKIARIVLLGDKDDVAKKNPSLNLSNIEFVNPKTNSNTKLYIDTLVELRKDKGMDEAKATSLVLNDPLYYGAMMVKLGHADGMVGGAINSTGNLLRPALQIIKTMPGIKTVSGAFIMSFDNTLYKDQKAMVFADCAVNIEPTAEQLADIAIASVNTAKVLAGISEPRVAMLSFSTKGSAKHAAAQKVIDATNLVKDRNVDFIIDGELQVDAALVKEVHDLKAPGGKVDGKANILIFPDLQSGNIGYKLTQRLANASAIGPICQGFAKPVNDLSRGCSVDDIVAVTAITVLQASEK